MKIEELCTDCVRVDICSEANECQRPCLICGGEGTVDGHDHADPNWDYENYNDPFMECTSCKGTGLAKDMTWC